MGILDDFRELADSLRALQGAEPFGLDVVQSQLTIRTITWAGGHPGADGGSSNSDVVLPKYYPILPVSTREIMNSGGRFENGMMKVGPITPTFTSIGGGGFSEAQLHPSPADDAHEIVYIVTGQHQGEYQLVEMQSSRPYSYFLVLKRRETTPSVV